MSTLCICFIPCFARKRGFSWLFEWHTWELIALALTGSDRWLSAREPWRVPVRPPICSRSEHTAEAQHRNSALPAILYIIFTIHHTFFLPQPAAGRGLGREASPTMCIWLPRSLPQGLWQLLSRASPWAPGQDRNTRLLTWGRQQAPEREQAACHG